MVGPASQYLKGSNDSQLRLISGTHPTLQIERFGAFTQVGKGSGRWRFKVSRVGI